MAATGILIGSIVFLLLGTTGYIISHVKIGQWYKNAQQRRSYQNLALVVSIMMTFCMWLHWVCAYMHQMNPILKPVPAKGE
jgi:hypothetical protein